MKVEMSAVDTRLQQRRDLYGMSFYVTLISHVFVPILFTPHLLPVASAVVMGGDDCSDDWVWGQCIPWSYDSNGCGIDGRQEARREGTGCHIIAFTMKCTPECPSVSSVHGGNSHIWRDNFPGINFPQPAPSYYDKSNFKTPSPVADHGKGGTNSADGRDKYPYNGKGQIPRKPAAFSDSNQNSDSSFKSNSGEADFSKDDKSKSEEFISKEKDTGNKEEEEEDGSEWGISQLKKPSSGCEYAVPSEWSQCERNGHKYRSKKLMSGPPVCSQVVEEVEQCRSNPPLLTDLSINYILNQKPKPTQPNTPTDKKQPSKNKPSTDAAPKKQPMKEDKQEKMSKDEPPMSAVVGGGVGGSVVRPQAEKSGTTCTYTKFSPWSKCVDGQKSRVQTLRQGPDTCMRQNTEYKRCTKARQTGCMYVREEKKCDKCSWERPGVRICRAPLDTNNSKSSCERSLIIEKPC